jgi:hypothetical protein
VINSEAVILIANSQVFERGTKNFSITKRLSNLVARHRAFGALAFG